MAAMKKGTATGRCDMFGEDIFVGDKLKKVGEGAIRIVNRYGGLSDESGTVIFAASGWKSAEYEVIREKVAIISEPAPVETPAEEPVELIEEPIEEEPSSIDLGAIFDDDLLDELRSRGFSGELTKTIIIKQKITL